MHPFDGALAFFQSFFHRTDGFFKIGTGGAKIQASKLSKLLPKCSPVIEPDTCFFKEKLVRAFQANFTAIKPHQKGSLRTRSFDSWQAVMNILNQPVAISLQVNQA